MAYVLRSFDEFMEQASDWKPVPVEEFVRAPWGLGFDPFPTQIFMLKLIFGEELSNKERNIVARDMRGRKVRGKFTEKEYLEFLYNEGRSSIKHQEGEVRNLVWNGGRKTTKSTVVSLAMAYRLYQILSKYDPYEFFGLPEDSQIGMTNLASAEEQASVVFTNVQSAILRSPYFRPLLARDPTTSKIFLFTRKQRDQRYGLNGFKADRLVRPTFIVSITVSTESSSRGPNNCLLVFDEFAFFDLGSKSSERIYKAVHPSVAAFGKYAKTLMISSPASKSGKFYQMYQLAMEKRDPEFVYIETPTAEFNPNISADFLESEFDNDPQMALVEYGAKWEGASHKFFMEGELEPVVMETPSSYVRVKDEPHYVGVDLGVETDGTVYCVAHAEGDEVVVDDIVWYYPGQGQYAGFDELPLLETDEHGQKYGLVVDLANFVRPFPVVAGMVDQWNGKGLVSLAKLHGVPWLEAEHVTDRLNWEIARLFHQLVKQRKVRLPKKEGLVENLYELERVLSNRTVDGRRMYQVKAPESASAVPPKGHDDIYSALSRAVWLVYTREIETGKALRRAERRRHKSQVMSPPRRGRLQRMSDVSSRMERLQRMRGQRGQVATFVGGRRGRR